MSGLSLLHGPETGCQSQLENSGGKMMQSTEGIVIHF